VFERKIFFSLKIYGKLAELSNKFEPSMVFDPSEFKRPRFDLYICKMLISIFSWFFHTVFKDLDPLPLLISRSLEGWHVCHSMLKLRIHFRLILIVYTKCIDSSPYTHVAV
jgi:hypothetical protein